MTMTHYEAGEKVVVTRAFTTPIGAHFSPGDVLTVIIGGPTAGRSIKLHADRCGSVVWIVDGLILGCYWDHHLGQQHCDTCRPATVSL